MKSTIALVGLGFGASVAAIIPHVIPQTPYGRDFTLKAHGASSASGTIGQLGDGQNRIGGGRMLGRYILKDGGVWDEHGRGCILTPATTQWQCDQGVKPSPGFAVNCNGKFTYQGKSTFYACPVNDHGEWNIYTRPAFGQLKCIVINLTAEGSRVSSCTPPVPHQAPNKDNCDKKATSKCILPKPSPRPTYSASSCKGSCDTPSQSRPTSPVYNKTCPLDLLGAHVLPHLIVPVDNHKPHKHLEKHLDNGLNGTVEAPNKCTTVNFDMHPRFAGKTCSVIFLLPHRSKLEASAYKLSGDNHTAVFKALGGPIGHEATWNNKPSGKVIKTVKLSEGSKHHISTNTCASRKTVAYEICGTNGLQLDYFQDFNPSSIGLYVRVC